MKKSGSPLLRARLKAKQALDMRLEGRSLPEIAEALGYSNESGPYNAIQRLLARHELESVDELRRVESARLEELLQAVWVRGLLGDIDCINACLRIMASRARLLGLERPVKFEAEVTIKEHLILQIEGHPPRILDLANFDPRTLSEPELEVLARLAPILEGEAKLLPARAT